MRLEARQPFNRPETGALVCPVGAPRLPSAVLRACARSGVPSTRFILVVRVRRQRMWLFHRTARLPRSTQARFPRPLPTDYVPVRTYRISTSRFGTGQISGSRQTPLGLHRIAQKIGGGHPVGTAFRSRRAIGAFWADGARSPILHRILWLEGLEPGLNRNGDVDTFRRFIYIHGTDDAPSLGRPASQGCIHLGADDLLPLFDRIPIGTLVWIEH